jgi:hypothetical protein
VTVQIAAAAAIGYALYAAAQLNERGRFGVTSAPEMARAAEALPRARSATHASLKRAAASNDPSCATQTALHMPHNCIKSEAPFARREVQALDTPEKLTTLIEPQHTGSLPTHPGTTSIDTVAGPLRSASPIRKSRQMVQNRSQASAGRRLRKTRWAAHARSNSRRASYASWGGPTQMWLVERGSH